MESANAQMLVTALIEDVRVLDDLDGLLSVEGIQVYAVGEKDAAQSMGLPGQSSHPRVKKLDATVSEAVHAAGRKMWADAVTVARANNLFLDAARSHLESRKDG